MNLSLGTISKLQNFKLLRTSIWEINCTFADDSNDMYDDIICLDNVG